MHLYVLGSFVEWDSAGENSLSTLSTIKQEYYLSVCGTIV